MFLDGRLSSGDLVRYWIAQFAGGVLASLVLLVATSRRRQGNRDLPGDLREAEPPS